jgi:hypothetical protein
MIGGEEDAPRTEDNEVFCENAPTVQAMEAVSGNVIAEGRTINNTTGGHIGREIKYSVDELNLLEGFSSVEDASHELIAAYRKQQHMAQRKER